MLEYDPQHRISAGIALQHPYFAELRATSLEDLLAATPVWPLTEPRGPQHDGLAVVPLGGH